MCLSTDGERAEVCERIVWSGYFRWHSRSALPRVCVFPLRLLASPVKASGCEGVMSPQIATTVGHTQTVARLPSEGHLHRHGAVEGQCTSSRLEAGGQAGEGGEPATRSHGRSCSEETHPMALKEILRHHRPQGLRVSQGLQLGEGWRMLGKVWQRVWLEEQLWCG